MAFFGFATRFEEIKRRRFHFELVWTKEAKCEKMISKSWGVLNGGNTLTDIQRTLERCVSKLTWWSKFSLNSIQEMLKIKRAQL